MKNKIEIRYEKREFQKKVKKKLVLEFATKVLKELKLNENICSIFFTTNATIKKLNHQYLKKNYATDVLSFSQLEGEKIGKLKICFLGDIVICIPFAENQAKDKSHSLILEIYLLILHGILHLAGFDHEKDKDEKMLKLQQKLFQRLTGEKIDLL